jgi:stage III sporulation protein AH
VCAGILATKVNSPLYVDGTEIGEAADGNSKGNFFTESRLDRDNMVASTLPTYQTIIDDPTTAKEQKQTMMEKFKSLTTNTENEKKIEAQLLGKGFEDSFCQIGEEKVMVYVKSKEDISEKQAKDIKNIVVGFTKIKDVEIARKQ